MVSMKYCPICGNLGVTPEGDPCTCQQVVQTFYDSVSCLDIPEQYRGIMFNQHLVPRDVDSSYCRLLQDVYDKVTRCNWNTHNMVIASPINHSKTVLAYSCIEVLFRQGIPVFPVFDLLEIKRMILDMDYGRGQFYEIQEPERLYTVPVLFVKIPRVADWAVFDTFATLLDRRVRRSNSTIFLYDGIWNFLVKSDHNGILSGLMGDGNYNTVEVKAYECNTKPLENFVQQNNIG